MCGKSFSERSYNIYTIALMIVGLSAMITSMFMAGYIDIKFTIPDFDLYLLTMVLMINGGVMVSSRAFIGYRNAAKGTMDTLLVYSAILICLFIGTAGSVYLTYDRFDIASPYRESFINATRITNMRNYHKNPFAQFYVDYLQQSEQCCGFLGPSDWLECSNYSFPVSCCPLMRSPCNIESSYYKRGCGNILFELRQYIGNFMNKGLIYLCCILILSSFEGLVMSRYLRALNPPRSNKF